MFRSRFRQTIAAGTLSLLLGSCATTQLPPISSAGAQFEPERDEARLWELSREEEKKLLAEAKVYQDPLLEDYLEGVVERLNPPGMKANPRVRYRVTVLEDPTLNAFAMPHGSLYVHTGLLARMESEDELATVLGHEMTHVEARHMLRLRRSARNKQIALSLAALGAAVVVADKQGDALRKGDYGKAARIGVLSDVLVGLGLQLAYLAAVNGYGRSLELEADDGGLEKMADAGYDTREAPKVYEALLDDHGDPGKVEAFFFGSHPKLTRRLESSRAWIAAHPAGAEPGQPRSPDGEFAARIRPVLRDDARLNIELGRLELAEDELDRALAAMPEDAEAHVVRSSLLQAQAEKAESAAERDRLQSAARGALEEAIRLDPERPAAHRELGLLAYGEADYATACAEFRRYVELAPDAEDAGSVRDYLLELRRDGHCP